MNNVTLCENALDPTTWTTHDCDDVRRFLVDHFGEWPHTARIYLNRVGRDTDVTPYDEAGVERLATLNGHFFVVVYPEGFSTIILIVAIALSAASVALSFLLRPQLPENQQSQSATNSLTNRQNKERLGGRIPDIYGTLWVTPDLIGVPYRIFIGNKEVEYMFMCIGRGEYEISEVRDDVTPIEQIDGAGCEIYGPNTSPNSGDDPQESYGVPVDTPIKNVKQYSSVNGQELRAPNADKFKADNNVRFTDAGVVEGYGDIDFTDFFSAGTIANPKYLIISGSDYDGTYLILSVTPTQIVLSDPGSVNAAWNTLSGETDYESPTLLNSGDNWEGPFYILDNTLTELWCNFVATQGLYELDSDGNQHAMSVTVQIEVTSIDSEYNTQGSAVYYQTTLQGSEVLRSQCGATLTCILPIAGSCQVRARRLTNTDLRDGWQVMDEVKWRDLYGASPIWEDVSPPTMHFGNVTTIQTVTWPTPQALSLKQRKINVLVGRKETSTTTIPVQTVSTQCLIGCWAADTGQIIGYPFAINLSFTCIVPTGATRLQLGMNDGNQWSDNDIGPWILSLKINGVSQSNLSVDGRCIPWRTAGGINAAFNGVAGMTTGLDPTIVPAEEGQTFEIAYISGLAGVGGPFDPQTTEGDVGTDGRIAGIVGRYIPTAIQTFTGIQNLNNAADILCRMALDEYIGRRVEAEIDRATIVAVLGPGGEVETYFGTDLCTQFSYAFDDKSLSFEEMAAQVCQAVFCVPYRLGNVLSVKFEKLTDDSLLLFNHRNKLPGTETRTVKFGTTTENDGIELTYVEPNAPNAQNIDSAYTLFFPEDQSATAAKKITAIGVRNRLQAWMLGWRMYQKLLYQNHVTQFDATAEAALAVISDRILVADNTRSDTQDGEIIAQNGLELTLSQPVTWSSASPAPNYTIFLQAYDGTVEGISITPGSAANKVVLAGAPAVALVVDQTKYARTTYMIVSDDDEGATAFLLQEKDAKDGGVYGIKAVNYDSRYYDHDQDYAASPRLIDVITPGDGTGAGYSAQASSSVFVHGKTMPWLVDDNPSYDYGIDDGKPPVAVTIQAGEGDSVAIAASAPGQPVTQGWWELSTPNTVRRSNEGDPVDAEGEQDYITGDSDDFGGDNGYFPTHYTTDKSLGRCGLIGCWAKTPSPAVAGVYEVIEPFVIGFNGNFTVPAGGVNTLLLGINDNKFSDNFGGFQVSVTQTGVAAGAAASEDPEPDAETENPLSTTYTITINGA